jgi:hypothetical protein
MTWHGSNEAVLLLNNNAAKSVLHNVLAVLANVSVSVHMLPTRNDTYFWPTLHASTK